MKKAKLVGHLQELDAIRRDEYMPEEVIDKVIELEKLLTKYLAQELENPTDRRYDKSDRQMQYGSLSGLELSKRKNNGDVDG